MGWCQLLDAFSSRLTTEDSDSMFLGTPPSYMTDY